MYMGENKKGSEGKNESIIPGISCMVLWLTMGFINVLELMCLVDTW